MKEDRRSGLSALQESPTCTQSTTLCSQASTPFGFTRLLVKLPTPHFPFQAASFNKLSEPADRFLD
jgi:hypothetical protein